MEHRKPALDKIPADEIARHEEQVGFVLSETLRPEERENFKRIGLPIKEQLLLVLGRAYFTMNVAVNMPNIGIDVGMAIKRCQEAFRLTNNQIALEKSR